MTQKVANTSLNRRRSTRSLILRMAADAERAERIRGLKDQRPDLTWARIADAVGVTERSAHGWRKTGAMSYEHAKKLATFLDIDLDWLWRGPHETPDLMGAISPAGQLDRLEGKIDQLLALALEQELKDAASRVSQPSVGTAAGGRGRRRKGSSGAPR
jgi:hypothetical protein